MAFGYLPVAFSLVLWASAFKVHFDFDGIYEDVEDAEKEIENRQFIFPGTKWCGTGNIAHNYSDLGAARDTDMCCRDHDYCDDIIEANESKHNLTNNSYYTRLNCRCDEKFYDCLKHANSRTSYAVGNTYFNVLGTKCFRFDYPITGCIKKHTLTRRCLVYQFNETSPKVWEWFDEPIY